MYVTAVQLADRPGATELAQVATPERDAIVDAGLMDATLRNADRSAWTPDLTAVADAALANVQRAIADADSMIDGFLTPRIPLPVDTTQFPIVVVWATAIVRYLLHKDRRSLANDDPIVRDYQDAKKLLTLTRAGQFSLGATDPAPAGGSPVTSAKPAVIDSDTLDGYFGNL